MNDVERKELKAKLLGDRPRLRIVNEGASGISTRIYLGDLDITSELKVTAITMALDVDELNRCSIECIAFGTEISAELDDLMIRHVGPRRGRLRFWRLRKWWWGVRRERAG